MSLLDAAARLVPITGQVAVFNKPHPRALEKGGEGTVQACNATTRYTVLVEVPQATSSPEPVACTDDSGPVLSSYPSLFEYCPATAAMICVFLYFQPMGEWGSTPSVVVVE